MAQTETGRTPVSPGSVSANSQQDDPRAVKLASTAGTVDPRVPTRNTNPADPRMAATAVRPDTPGDAAYKMSAAVAHSQPSTFFPVPFGPLLLGTPGDPNIPVLATTVGMDEDGDTTDPRDPPGPEEPTFGPRESPYPDNTFQGLGAAVSNIVAHHDAASVGPNNPRPTETGGFKPQDNPILLT